MRGRVAQRPSPDLESSYTMAAMADTVTPTLGDDVYIAPTAYVGGDVRIGDQSTIMHHAVVRGDVAAVRVGCRVNVQDGAILHTAHDVQLDIADEVAIGHRAVVHCREVGSRTLIGIGAIILDDCVIGRDCIIAAGTVLAPGTRIPDGSVVMGLPGRVVRKIVDRDLRQIDEAIDNYIEMGRLHSAGCFPNIAGVRTNE